MSVHAVCTTNVQDGRKVGNLKAHAIVKRIGFQVDCAHSISIRTLHDTGYETRLYVDTHTMIRSFEAITPRVVSFWPAPFKMIKSPDLNGCHRQARVRRRLQTSCSSQD